MEELKKQHLETLQLLESIEVMLQNGDSIHPNSIIRGAIQTAIGMEINLNQNNMKETAVEWLENEFQEMCKDFGGIDTDFIERFEQAKQMEKEQINKSTSFICHGCGTHHSGENNDQMYEVCKQCFINL